MKRLKNIIIAGLVLIFSLFRRSAKRDIQPKSFVIFYSTNNIGDMVCATPIFRAIKEHNSEIRVVVVGAPKNRSLLAHTADVDDYISMTDSVWKLLLILHKRRFDAGIVLSNSTTDLAMLLLGGVKSISCFRLTEKYKDMEARPYKMISSFVHQIEYLPGRYVPEQYLNLLGPFGINKTRTRKHLEYSEEARILVKEKLLELGISNDDNIVMFAPGAGAAYKQWPPDRFAQVANRVYEEFGMPIGIIGGPDDAAAVDGMIRDLEKGVLYWNPGPLSMDILKAVLSRACLVVGNDSGAIHVGEAVGTRTLTIAGPTDVDEHMREDESHKILRAEFRVGSLYRAYVVDENTMDLDLAREQMASITIDKVFKAVASLLSSYSHSNK